MYSKVGYDIYHQFITHVLTHVIIYIPRGIYTRLYKQCTTPCNIYELGNILTLPYISHVPLYIYIP